MRLLAIAVVSTLTIPAQAEPEPPRVVSRPWAITADVGLHSHGTIGFSVERGVGRYLAGALGVGAYVMPTVDTNGRASGALRVRYPWHDTALGLSAETWVGAHEAGRYREDTCHLRGAVGAGGTAYLEYRGASGFVFRGSFGRSWIVHEGRAPCTETYDPETLLGLSFGGSL